MTRAKSTIKPYLFLFPGVPAMGKNRLRGVLKLPTGYQCKIEESKVLYLGSGQEPVFVQMDAFNLHHMDEINGPVCYTRGAVSSPPPEARSVIWYCNNFQSEELQLDIAPDYSRASSMLFIHYIPVQVGIANDTHLLIDYFHAGEDSFNWTDAPNGVSLIVDGERYGYHPKMFNGSIKIQPKTWTTLKLNLDAFPQIPRVGSHRMSVCLGDCISPGVEVSWKNLT